MELYKATGNSGFTLYAVTENTVYCEIHHPSGAVGTVRELDDSWPIERVVGQLGAEPIDESALPEESNITQQF